MVTAILIDAIGLMAKSMSVEADIDAESLAEFIKEVELPPLTKKNADAHIAQLHSLLKCRCATIACGFKDGEAVFVDDEGKLKDGDQVFVHTPWLPYPLAGNLLIMGLTNNGNPKKRPKWTREQIIAMVQGDALVFFARIAVPENKTLQ